MTTSKKEMLTGGLLDVLGSFANNTPAGEQGRKEPADVRKAETVKPKERKTGEGSAASRKLWSFRIKEDVYGKIAAIAYWDRKNIQTVMDEILDDAIASYEKANGEIRPVEK